MRLLIVSPRSGRPRSGLADRARPPAGARALVGPRDVEEIDGITIECPTPNKILVKGTDKQVVGQFAAEVRGKRPPEPYKGKGIKYADEVIRRKVGKTGGKK